MPEVSYPFSTSLVRAAEWQALVAPLGSDGVILDPDGESAGLQVDAQIPSAMSVKVSPGRASIRGFHYEMTDSVNLAVEPNTSGSVRWDRVVVRLSRDLETVAVQILKGVPAAGLPELASGQGNLWDLPLARIQIPNNAVSISAGNVTRDRTFIGAGLPQTEAPEPPGGRGLVAVDRRLGLGHPNLMAADSAVGTPGRQWSLLADLGDLRSFSPQVPGPGGVTATCKWRMAAKDVVFATYVIDFSQAFNDSSGNINIHLPVAPLKPALQFLPGFARLPVTPPASTKYRPAALMMNTVDSSDTWATFWWTPDTNGNDYETLKSIAAGTRFAFTGTYLVDSKDVQNAMSGIRG